MSGDAASLGPSIAASLSVQPRARNVRSGTVKSLTTYGSGIWAVLWYTVTLDGDVAVL